MQLNSTILEQIPNSPKFPQSKSYIEEMDSMFIELTNQYYQIVTSTSVKQNITFAQALDSILQDWSNLNRESEIEVIDQEDKLDAITAKLEQVD
ncbi:MAG: hypothetical protein QNJ72_26175 [Pleurocapsa sp. MO_226.B13]|nr:hypothetical protein [Pleurocapsa sp. MO_226.B13]